MSDIADDKYLKMIKDKDAKTIEFIDKAIKVHGSKYDYSLVEYTLSKNHIKILCPKHEQFEQVANYHIMGHGCRKCALDNISIPKISKDEFIENAKKLFGDTYDYSKVIYKNMKTKVTILCPKHGSIEQSPMGHLKFGCGQCGMDNKSPNKISTKEKFIEKAIEIHGNKFGYESVDYKGHNIVVKISCATHGFFMQKPTQHLEGRACQKCGKTKPGEQKKLTLDEFIKRAQETHGETYLYTKLVYTGMNDNIEIICKKHNSFFQMASHHIKGSGCPKCRSSKGESVISDYLKSIKLSFVRQKKFSECKNIYQLPFDFYIESYNLLVEYHGQQHYFPVSIFGGEKAFESQQVRDKIKQDYALSNGINLLIIPYTTLKKEDIANTLQTKFDEIKKKQEKIQSDDKQIVKIEKTKIIKKDDDDSEDEKLVKIKKLKIVKKKNDIIKVVQDKINELQKPNVVKKEDDNSEDEKLVKIKKPKNKTNLSKEIKLN